MQEINSERPYQILYVVSERLGRALAIQLAQTPFFETSEERGMSHFFYLKKGFFPPFHRRVLLVFSHEIKFAQALVQKIFFNHIFLDERSEKLLLGKKSSSSDGGCFDPSSIDGDEFVRSFPKNFCAFYSFVA